MRKRRLSHLCAAGVLLRWLWHGSAIRRHPETGLSERFASSRRSARVFRLTWRRGHLADALTKRWKQSVVVENRPGADTMLGTQAFLDARDDHALLFTTHSTFTVVPLLRAKVPYDPVGDVKPISLAVEDFLSVAVSRTLEVGSLSDFVKLAREKPTKLNFYAAPGAPYLAYLAFQKRAGIDTTFVAYNSPVSAISDLSEGRIHIAVMPLASVLGAVQAGKIKLLAVTNAKRTPAAPDVPTVAESGYPEFTFGGFLGLFGPKDMPTNLRERIAVGCARHSERAGHSTAADKCRTDRARHDAGRIRNGYRSAAHEMVRDRSRTQHRAAVIGIAHVWREDVIRNQTVRQRLTARRRGRVIARPETRFRPDSLDDFRLQVREEDVPWTNRISRQGRPVAVERSGVTVTRVGANLGAEISGVDLRQRAVGRGFQRDP